MKKLFSLLAMVFLFASCGGGEIGHMHEDGDVRELQGYLEMQSNDDDRSGTHILVQSTDADSMSEVAVRSLVFNLSDDDYLDSEVKVVAVYDEDEDVFNVTGISVVEVLNSDNTKPTIRDYRNVDLGFKLKYYSNWELIEDGAFVAFTASSEDEELPSEILISQEAFAYQPVADGEEIIDNPLGAYMEAAYSDVSNFDSNTVGPDSLDAVKFKLGQQVNYILYRSGFVYSLEFIPGDNGDEDLLDFEDMVRSFGFIGFDIHSEEEHVEDDEDSFSVADLPVLDIEFSTFESLPFKFTGKYPASWYYAGSSGGGNVVHHYGFSDEPIQLDNELIALDVVSSAIPSGKKVNLGSGRTGVVVEEDSLVSIYFEEADKTFRVSGNSEYEGIMLVISSSIKPVSEEE